MAHFAELESKTDPTGFTSDTHLIVTVHFPNEALLDFPTIPPFCLGI